MKSKRALVFSGTIVCAFQQQPAARACHAATATSAGAVVWGGAVNCGVNVLSDSSLWLWNGTAWRKLAGPPIQPREDALLLNTDSTTSLTLLGGRRNGVVSADVWRYDGTRWQTVPTTGGPGAIQHGAAAYDRVRKRVVVFGGAVGRSLSGKTYEWDGSRWFEFDVPGPSPRIGPAMAWSGADGGVLLYGGFAGDKKFRDLWKWSGQRWELLTESGPTYTEGHVMTESDAGVFLIGAGLIEAPRVRAWRWHAGRFQEQGDIGPALRVGATATYDRNRRMLLYWGGSNGAGTPARDVNEFDGTRWQVLTPR
jgi:hypothetical protein